MNSDSTDQNGHFDPEPSDVQLLVSTPSDEGLTRKALDEETSDEDGDERFDSPWSKMMRGVGDVLPVGADGSFLQSEEEEGGQELCFPGQDIDNPLESFNPKASQVRQSGPSPADERLTRKEEEEVQKNEKQDEEWDLEGDYRLEPLNLEPSQVQRPVSTSSDEILLRRCLDEETCDENSDVRFDSPCSKMMRGVGGVGDDGSFLQSEEEGEEEEVQEEEGQEQSILNMGAEEGNRPVPRTVRRSLSSPADQRLTRRALGEDTSDVDLYDAEWFDSPWSEMTGAVGDVLPVCDTGSFLQSEGAQDEDDATMEEEQVTGLSGQNLEEDHQQECRGPDQWSWVVADLVYSKYGEKMRRLRNSIEDKLIHFRSQTNFRSSSVLKPFQEPLPEDEVSMLPLLLKDMGHSTDVMPPY